MWISSFAHTSCRHSRTVNVPLDPLLNTQLIESLILNRSWRQDKGWGQGMVKRRRGGVETKMRWCYKEHKEVISTIILLIYIFELFLCDITAHSFDPSFLSVSPFLVPFVHSSVSLLAPFFPPASHISNHIQKALF